MFLTASAFFISLLLCVDKILSKKMYKILVFTIIGLASIVPFYKSDFGVYYSFLELLYSFFDEPSIFAVLLLCFALLKKILNITSKFNPYAFVFLSLIIALVFLINLDLIKIDTTNINLIFLDSIFAFVFLVLLYIFDKNMAYIALICVFISWFLDKNIFNALFCVYIFIFSIVFSSFFLIKKFIKRCKSAKTKL